MEQSRESFSLVKIQKLFKDVCNWLSKMLLVKPRQERLVLILEPQEGDHFIDNLDKTFVQALVHIAR